MTPLQGALFLIAYGSAMIAIAALSRKNHILNQIEFLLAGRSIGIFAGAMSIAASWIWAPALFLGSQKAYDQGVAGVFWFTVPNVLALIVFAFLALKIRKVLPNGFTLPQLMRSRHGKGVHALYLVQFFGLQICSFAVQILAGSLLIQQVTGINAFFVSIFLVVIALTYSLLGGLRASITTDIIQMLIILVVSAITVPMAINAAGGISAVTNGLGGITGSHANPLDPWVAYSFGITVTIGLLSGPIGDQMHWQRAFAIKSDKDVMPTFFVAAFIFVLIPLSLSMLGFIAAGANADGHWNIDGSQLIGAITIERYLPSFLTVIFSVMLLSGLCSTLDSILSAAASLTSVDLKTFNDQTGSRSAADAQTVNIARIGMLITALLGLCIALLPGIKIVYLFLFYGTLRASTAIPTVLTLFWSKLESKPVFYAILLSILFGAPVYAAGVLLKNTHLSVAGSLLVVVLGFAISTLGSLYSRK